MILYFFVTLSLIKSLEAASCPNNVNVTNANVTYSSDPSSLGQSASITCFAGYVVSGTNNSTQTNYICGTGSSWIGSSTCVLNSTITTTTVANAGSSSTVQVAQQITCETLSCVNNGTCIEGNPATCSCTSAYTGPNCDMLVTHSIDLNAIRSMSQKAYYTQKYWVDWSEESISGDQLKIAMSCSIAILGSLLSAGSYYLSKSLFPVAPLAPPTF